MSDNELVARMEDMKIKKERQDVVDIVELQGEAYFKPGSKLIVRTPNMPYEHTPIPDGQSIWARFTSGIVTNLSILGGFLFGVHKANGETTNNTTVNNNTAGVQP